MLYNVGCCYRVLLIKRGIVNGYSLHSFDSGVFCTDRLVDFGLPILKGVMMSWIYLLSAGMALLVFVYLLVALFYPEKF